jgi:molybdopterin-binding protein
LVILRINKKAKGENRMRISARNQLKGKIIRIDEGAVNGVVVIDIGGGKQITSVITMNAIKELGLKVGGEAYAVIKASSVMVAVD